MRVFKKILFIFILFVFVPKVYAESNLVNIYFFHSNSCSHCAKESKLLDVLENKYDNIKIYRYEIGDEENSKLLKEVAELLDIDISGVPFTVIGSKAYSGYNNDSTKETFIGTIDYFSKYGYIDKVGEYLGKDLPSYKINDEDITLEEYLDDYGNYKINIPLIGNIETKNLTLPIISAVIGLVDGFNPCAMWVLLFLISMLLGMQNKKKMFILGIAFLVTSALIYLMFMLAWLNVASLLIMITPIRIIFSLIAIIGGIFNLVSFIKSRKDNGCNIVNEKKRTKIFSKIKKFTTEKNFILALIGVITLAISVNVIELACSAGLPIMFIEILSLNNLSMVEYSLYIFIYILCFLLDDLIVFIVAMSTLKLTGISTKYGKLSKLVGGILLVLIGLLLMLKPNILMFNF